MTEVLTSAQMRAIERAAIDSGAVTGLALMERAGQGVVDAILAQWPGLATGTPRAVVLCGPGNNGGDGFVVARLLKARGWDVRVLLLGNSDRLAQDAAAQRDAWLRLGAIQHAGATCDHTFAQALEGALSQGDGLSIVVIDALFGIGLSRAPEDAFCLFQHLPHPAEVQRFGVPLRRVAIDVPTGLHADTGKVLSVGARSCPFSADLTVTFHAPKPGHLTGDGPRLCGRLVVADIGLGPWDHHRHDA